MQLQTEVWKPIFGFEGLYQVSNHGNVRRFFKKKAEYKTCKGGVKQNGYRFVDLYRKCKCKRMYVHRLVAQAFIGDIEGKLVCHKDDIRDNNYIDNLFIGTHSDNSRDSVRKGRWHKNRGEKHGQSKLTKTKVKLIKLMIDMGKGQKEIAEHFKISTSNVWAIKFGHSWKHIS